MFSLLMFLRTVLYRGVDKNSKTKNTLYKIICLIQRVRGQKVSKFDLFFFDNMQNMFVTCYCFKKLGIAHIFEYEKWLFT